MPNIKENHVTVKAFTWITNRIGAMRKDGIEGGGQVVSQTKINFQE
jgi:hypothetical protein